MVKIMPQCLAFKKDDMAPSLDGFADAFGLEESKEMVMRNPGLVGAGVYFVLLSNSLTFEC